MNPFKLLIVITIVLLAFMVSFLCSFQSNQTEQKVHKFTNGTSESDAYLEWNLRNSDNADYSYYDFVTFWIGAQANGCTNKPLCNDLNEFWENTYLIKTKKTEKIPILYGNIIEFKGHNKGINECNQKVSDQMLCKKRANFIRNNTAGIIEKYVRHAKKAAEYLGRDAWAMFLIEPSFYQYLSKKSNHTAQGDGLFSHEYLKSLFNNITESIKSALPNALISWEIKPGEELNNWWNFFNYTKFIDFIDTSNKTKKDPFSHKTWTEMDSLIDKKIISDSGCGIVYSEYGGNLKKMVNFQYLIF